jgi:hypothetical protein
VVLNNFNLTEQGRLILLAALAYAAANCDDLTDAFRDNDGLCRINLGGDMRTFADPESSNFELLARRLIAATSGGR